MPRGSAPVDEDHVPRTQKQELHSSNSASTQPWRVYTRVIFLPRNGAPTSQRGDHHSLLQLSEFSEFFFFFAITMDSQGGCWWEGDGDSLLQLSKFSELFFLQ